MCLDENGELEFENRYEIDGTEDGSAWTSIETDGLNEISPSIDELIEELP